MAHDGVTPRVARSEFLQRADVIDGGVRRLLADLEFVADDPEHERFIDALMGVSMAADALRALARDDVAAAEEATRSMAFYANRAVTAD